MSLWDEIEACQDVQPLSTAPRHHYHAFYRQPVAVNAADHIKPVDIDTVVVFCCHCLEPRALHDFGRTCRNHNKSRDEFESA